MSDVKLGDRDYKELVKVSHRHQFGSDNRCEYCHVSQSLYRIYQKSEVAATVVWVCGIPARIAK